MATRSGPGRGLRGFRLSDVPETVRLRALEKLLRTPGSVDGMLLPTPSFADRIALGVAATRPSGSTSSPGRRTSASWGSVEWAARSSRRTTPSPGR
jgi:hypothetical protein